jgi:DNA-binding response OmpR family regulator
MCSENSPCNILFVENDTSIVRVIKTQAEDYLSRGIRFLFAASIAEAKRIIADTEVVIIILDLSLNDSTGINTLKSVVALTIKKRTPIYVYTGIYDEVMRHQLIDIGAREVFFKSDISLLNTVVFAHHAANEERKTQRLRSERDMAVRSASALQSKCDILQDELDFIKRDVKEEAIKQRFGRFEKGLQELREGVKRLAATH